MLNGHVKWGTIQGSHSNALSALDVWLRGLRTENADVLGACERFIEDRSKAKTAQPIVQQVIGMVTMLFARYDFPLVYQSPGDAKRIASRALLKRADLWTTAAEVGCPDANDINDAMRHAVLASARYRAQAFEKIFTAGNG